MIWKRAPATAGVSVRSKHSHCRTRARPSRLAGTKAVPSARYQRIAADSASGVPSSSSRTGVVRAGLSAANAAVSVSPAKMSTGTRS
jgi:hypothetical protein